jgi:hypothetical protein
LKVSTGRFSSDRTVAEYASEIWGLVSSGDNGREAKNA